VADPLDPRFDTDPSDSDSKRCGNSSR